MYRQHTLEPIQRDLLVYLAQDTMQLAELWRTVATELLVVLCQHLHQRLPLQPAQRGAPALDINDR